MPAVPTEAILPSRKIYAADYLGLVPYELALKWQEALVPARAEGVIPDCLLLLQHPPVLTVGRFRGDEDIMVPPEVLAERGVTIFHTNRGGGTTYHGPGQLVGYPIMNLIENNFGVREYLRKLEEVILKLLLVFGLRAMLSRNGGSARSIGFFAPLFQQGPRKSIAHILQSGT